MLLEGTYDALDAGPAASLFGIPDLRSQLLGMARGSVLETGIGTGINLSLYDRHKVTTRSCHTVSGCVMKHVSDFPTMTSCRATLCTASYPC